MLVYSPGTMIATVEGVNMCLWLFIIHTSIGLITFHFDVWFWGLLFSYVCYSYPAVDQQKGECIHESSLLNNNARPDISPPKQLFLGPNGYLAKSNYNRVIYRQPYFILTAD